MNSSAFGSRSRSRNGEGSMALNNCLSSATWTSMSSQFAGRGSPAATEEWLDMPGRSALLTRSRGSLLAAIPDSHASHNTPSHDHLVISRPEGTFRCDSRGEIVTTSMGEPNSPRGTEPSQYALSIVTEHQRMQSVVATVE